MRGPIHRDLYFDRLKSFLISRSLLSAVWRWTPGHGWLISEIWDGDTSISILNGSAVEIVKSFRPPISCQTRSRLHRTVPGWGYMLSALSVAVVKIGAQPVGLAGSIGELALHDGRLVVINKPHDLAEVLSQPHTGTSCRRSWYVTGLKRVSRVTKGILYFSELSGENLDGAALFS